MADITLPQEIMEKIVQRMADDILSKGMDWGLRNAIENEIKQRVLDSGVIDNIADDIITYILDNQSAIIEHIGSEFIKVVGESLSEVYKRVAQAIVTKVKW